MPFTIIIPARYDSTRLPGKVLEDIAGKPMLQWVYEQSQKAGAERVVIATDDDRIREAAEGFGAPVCMTSADHSSGTERIAEAAEALELDDDDIIIGVQGDEPLIPVETIRKVAASLEEHEHVRVASACELIKDQAELFSPHVTKVILNRRNYAMYFSRAPIPWELGNFAGREVPIVEGDHYRHVGLYGYRAPFLRDYIEWEPCAAESMEKLEQLRILWHGGRLHMTIMKHTTPPGVDTQEDLDRMRELMKRKK